MSEIVITFPAPPGGSGPVSHPVSSDGKTCASGTLDNTVPKSLVSIRGQVNGGPFKDGVVGYDLRSWTIENIESAVLGPNALKVTGFLTDGASQTPATPCLRDFVGVLGICHPSGGVFTLACAEAAPASKQQVMPRFYRLSLDAQSLDMLQSGQDLLLGGLLQRTSIYLAYDAAQSTPESPVWRDINLPSPAGSWILRVCQSGGRHQAKLALVRVSDSFVLPPLAWLTDDWRFQQPNTLSADKTCAESPLSRAVWVEPA